MLYKKYLALIFTSLADYCRTGAPGRQPGFSKNPRHEKLKGWSKSNLSLVIHRETICNHTLLSKSGGGHGKIRGPFGFQGRGNFRLNETDTLFTHNGMLLEFGVVVLRIVNAVMRPTAFQTGQR